MAHITFMFGTDFIPWLHDVRRKQIVRKILERVRSVDPMANLKAFEVLLVKHLKAKVLVRLIRDNCC
jgi:hypothetical protein